MPKKMRLLLAGLSLTIGFWAAACSGAPVGFLPLPVVDGPLTNFPDLKVMEVTPLNVRESRAAAAQRAVTQLALLDAAGTPCHLER